MELQEDFRKLLELFNAAGVEYLVVGGYALAHHGAPRFTGDLDLFIRPIRENAERILQALADFGFASLELNVDDFIRPEQVVQLGVPPVRIDLIAGIDGVSWDEAWAGRTDGTYSDVAVQFIGRTEFVANKKASGRPGDLADLKALGKLA